MARELAATTVVLSSPNVARSQRPIAVVAASWRAAPNGASGAIRYSEQKITEHFVFLLAERVFTSHT